METGQDPFVHNSSHPLQNSLFIGLNGIEAEAEVEEDHCECDSLHETPGMFDSAFQFIGDLQIGIILMIHL